MVASSLVTHCGARAVSREDLERVEAPPATGTWFPIKHSAVADAVSASLAAAGFEVRSTKFALSRGDARMFATMDLAAPMGSGVNLAVGVRNSTDKSFPLGFCAGARVFVCDNLAFRSELLVKRKHTRFGRDRFEEAICQAVRSLGQFKEQEANRILRLQHTALGDEAAESWILRGYEKGVVSHLLLPRVLKEWRQPSFEDFRPRTLWSLFNAFTAALGERQKSNPQQFAALTIRLAHLLDPDGGGNGDAGKEVLHTNVA
jgi:hypothetical protein